MLARTAATLLGLACSAAFRPQLLRSARLPPARAIATRQEGQAGTESYRLFFTEGDKTVSPWHDIPLRAGELFNFVTEIPKYTKAKMEVATKESHNPIAQDIKKGKLRDYHGPIFWNYGCLPQTWEDPSVLNPAVNCKGDNDPVDVVRLPRMLILVSCSRTGGDRVQGVALRQRGAGEGAGRACDDRRRRARLEDHRHPL